MRNSAPVFVVSLVTVVSGCSAPRAGNTGTVMLPDTGSHTDVTLAADASVTDGSFTGDAAASEVPRDSTRADPSASQLAYLKLLSAFPEDHQGLSLEPNDPTPRELNQTYALVLSSEAIRWRQAPSSDGERRIRKAVTWLKSNQLDNTGKPGWSWPVGFAGNPPGIAYTIDTAIALYGILDALSLRALWSSEEQDELRSIVRAVVLRWCRDWWLEGQVGGFFRYDLLDSRFIVNPSSMFMGAMLRFLKEQETFVGPNDRALAQTRADAIAQAMVSTVQLHNGLPHWGYFQKLGPDPINDSVQDTLHHAYTISGIELYRDLRGAVKLPWTRAQAVRSLDTYWDNGHIACYSSDEYDVVAAADLVAAATSWSAGFMLRSYGMWGETSKAAQVYDAIVKYYGPLPYLSYYAKGLPRPRNFDYQGDNTAFFPRWAAHVLVGFAYHAFGGP